MDWLTKWRENFEPLGSLKEHCHRWRMRDSMPNFLTKFANFLEFMRNSRYGIIEAQAVSKSIFWFHLRVSFLASRLNVTDHHIIVC